jgi:hypothetical protein
MRRSTVLNLPLQLEFHGLIFQPKFFYFVLNEVCSWKSKGAINFVPNKIIPNDKIPKIHCGVGKLHGVQMPMPSTLGSEGYRCF